MKSKVELLGVQNDQLRCANEENEHINQVLAKTKIEFEAVKIKHLSESKMKYNCEECDMSVETSNLLKVHVREYHTHSKSSQYEEVHDYEVYPCFYCDYTLTCSDNLEEHKTVSYTNKDFAPFPCNMCVAQCPEEADLGMQRTTYHGLGTFNEEPGIEIFWCDIS